MQDRKRNEDLKYLDINSDFRDRTTYPNQADFVIPLSQSSQSTDGMSAKSGTSLAIPYDYGTTTAISGTTVTLATTASNIDNYYVGSVIDLASSPGVFSIITAYNGTTKVATVTNTGSSPTFYNIRKNKPVYQGTAQAGSTTSSVIFPATASSVNNYYKGSYLGFTNNSTVSASLRGITRLITDYNGTTKTATTLPFPTSTESNDFDVDGFSVDSYFPLKYTGSQVSSSQPVCYECKLEHLVLPNQLVGNVRSNSPSNIGGRLNNYPYVYVSIYSETSRASEQILYSNNPNSTLATFKCPITYNFDPASTTATGNILMPFFTIYDLSPKTFKIKPNDILHFTITLPDGSLLTYMTPDNTPPLSINPSYQISCLISMKRL